MKRIDVPMIRSFDPCYDPTDKVSEDWSGTVLDVLALENVDAQGKFWLVLREEFLSAKLLRLFAVSCARDVQHLIKDERSIKAIDVAERYARGVATKEELDAARDAASEAANEGAWDAAWGAAWAAASEAASEAANEGAWDAAWRAAWAAASDAAKYAAWDAARDAAKAAAWTAASEAAWDVEWAAAKAAQVNKLREMILSMPEEVRS